MQTTNLGGVRRDRLDRLFEAERMDYVQKHPRSLQLAGNGIAGFYAGVPMHWMLDWSMPFPFLVAEAQGSVLRDVDGNEYADFCLGDTGSMFGHSPPPVVEAIRRQAGRGLTYMLPTEDAIAVGTLLRERFGLPHWQVATTATDANRFALRVARAVTGRRRVLVFNGCYHGTVDETFVRLVDGRPANRPGLLGQAADLTALARVVEFNDVAALEELAQGDVACVIAEPVMTNSCMVLPEPGFHDSLRRLTRATGTLLLIDETHTISSGPGGYTRAQGLEPDLFVVGRRRARERLGLHGGSRPRPHGGTRAIAARSLRDRHDPLRQCARAGGHARQPRAGHDERGLCAHGVAGRHAGFRPRGSDRGVPPPLARRARRGARRIRLRARPPTERI